MVEGYEFRKNQYVLLNNEDFDSVKVESSSVITIEVYRRGFDRPGLLRCRLLPSAGR